MVAGEEGAEDPENQTTADQTQSLLDGSGSAANASAVDDLLGFGGSSTPAPATATPTTDDFLGFGGPSTPAQATPAAASDPLGDIFGGSSQPVQP